MPNRKWAFEDFWELAVKIYNFLALLHPNFFDIPKEQMPNDNCEEFYIFQYDLQELIFAYKRLFSQMKHTTQTISEDLYTFIRQSEKQNR